MNWRARSLAENFRRLFSIKKKLVDEVGNNLLETFKVYESCWKSSQTQENNCKLARTVIDLNLVVETCRIGMGQGRISRWILKRRVTWNTSEDCSHAWRVEKTHYRRSCCCRCMNSQMPKRLAGFARLSFANLVVVLAFAQHSQNKRWRKSTLTLVEVETHWPILLEFSFLNVSHQGSDTIWSQRKKREKSALIFPSMVYMS